MPYPEITKPIPCPAAFQDDEPRYALSQAALLLALGMQLRADPEALRVRSAGVTGREAVSVFPGPDLEAFPIPQIVTTRRRMHPEEVRDRLLREGLLQRVVGPSGESALMAAPGALTELAERLYDEPTSWSATLLMESCLRHPDPLVRVAAAASYLEVTTDPVRPLQILAEGTYAADALVREVAATALSHAAPEHPRLAEILAESAVAAAGAPSRTAILLHGTFARGYTWWQPGGDFHHYIQTNVRPDLYAGRDRFDWSGGYSDAARLLAADSLRQWVANHQLSGLHVYAHSHGGSVAMLSSQGGTQINTLLLLSCPVHAHKYMPDFRRVRRTLSLRVRMDLVILADRGGQRFRDHRIEEHVLPVWFNHSASHDPDVWIRYGVPNRLGIP